MSETKFPNPVAGPPTPTLRSPGLGSGSDGWRSPAASSDDGLKSPDFRSPTSSVRAFVSPEKVSHDPFIIDIIEGRFVTAGEAVKILGNETSRLQAARATLEQTLTDHRAQEKDIMGRVMRLLVKKRTLEARGEAPSPQVTKRLAEYHTILDRNNQIKAECKRELDGTDSKLRDYKRVLDALLTNLKHLGIQGRDIGAGASLPKSLHLGRVPLSTAHQRRRDLEREVIEVIFHGSGNISKPNQSPARSSYPGAGSMGNPLLQGAGDTKYTSARVSRRGRRRNRRRSITPAPPNSPERERASARTSMDGRASAVATGTPQSRGQTPPRRRRNRRMSQTPDRVRRTKSMYGLYRKPADRTRQLMAMGVGTLDNNARLLETVLASHLRQTGCCGTADGKGEPPRALAARIVAACSNRTNLSGEAHLRLSRILAEQDKAYGGEYSRSGGRSGGGGASDGGAAPPARPKRSRRRSSIIKTASTSFLRPKISSDRGQITVAIRVFRDEVHIKHFDWFELTSIVNNEPVVSSRHKCLVTTVVRAGQPAHSTLTVHDQSLPFDKFLKAVQAKVKAFCAEAQSPAASTRTSISAAVSARE